MFLLLRLIWAAHIEYITLGSACNIRFSPRGRVLDHALTPSETSGCVTRARHLQVVVTQDALDASSAYKAFIAQPTCLGRDSALVPCRGPFVTFLGQV